MATPKKSIAELKASGSYRPNKHGREDEYPVLPIETPRMPSFLSEEAVPIFEELVGLGVDMNILTKADTFIVGLLSNEIEDWMALQEAVSVEGVIIKMPTATGFKQEVVNPKVKLKDDKLKIILRMLSELGMSPASRSKVMVNKHAEEEKSALGEFLKLAKQRANAGTSYT